MLGAVCKFNAQLLSVSLTWITDILTITFAFPHGNPIVLLHVYEHIYTFTLYMCLNMILATPTLVNKYVLAVSVYLYIVKMNENSCIKYAVVKQLFIRDVVRSQRDLSDTKKTYRVENVINKKLTLKIILQHLGFHAKSKCIGNKVLVSDV